jgi:HNH endonuclease
VYASSNHGRLLQVLPEGFEPSIPAGRPFLKRPCIPNSKHGKKKLIDYLLNSKMVKMRKRRHGPYSTQAGHLFWIDVFDDGTRKSVLVHREMMEQHLGRELHKDEVVHHKSEIPYDNRIDNFELKTRGDHTRDHAVPAETIDIICPECGEHANLLSSHVKRNQVKLKKAGPFCSKTCAGRWSRRMQIESGLINTGGGRPRRSS